MFNSVVDKEEILMKIAKCLLFIVLLPLIVIYGGLKRKEYKKVNKGIDRITYV